MNSPYTHPSMPGTSYRPYIQEDVLSAALEDAEGHALVEAIHHPDNPRLEANRDA